MKLNDKDLRICLFAYALSAASLAWGHDTGPEHIEAFDTRLDITDGGALDIAHVIDVHPHGDEIRRGLFFELPDDVGPLSDFRASIGGEPVEPDFDDGAIVVAAAEPLARHETHRFEVRYRAAAPWWLESSGTARLRWAPIIEQFELAWRDATVTLQWPQQAPPPAFPDAGSVDGNRWTLRLRGPLHEGASDARVGGVEFRVDASALPPASVRRYGEEWAWRGLLIAGIIALLGFLHTMWRAVGRDPDLGRVPSRDAAPDGISPAAARFVDRMGFDDTTFVTALLSLRVKQALDMTLAEDGEKLGLTRRDVRRRSLSPGERTVMDALFDDSESIELEAGGERGPKAAEALKKTLGKEHRGRHFVTNPRQRALAFVAGGALSVIGFVGLVLQARDDLTPDPWVIGLGFAALLVGLIAPAVYFELFKAPTRAGVEVKRQIAGLKHYFAESGSIRDARRFVELLPYAVALDAEETWRDRFAGADDSGADRDTAEVLAWYREVQRCHDTAAAMVPIIAAASGATAATGAGASGGASAGGV
jgi:hypothetical protein